MSRMLRFRRFDQTSHAFQDHVYVDPVAVALIELRTMPGCECHGTMIEVCRVAVPGSEAVWLWDEGRTASGAILERRGCEVGG